MDKLERMINTVPSTKQIAIQEMEYYNFIHFGLNTFTQKEWGSGNVSPSVWTLEDINTDRWVSDLKKTGSKGVIITAKHHDGFCLYPSKFTDYTIANTVYRNGKGDIVKQLQLSCEKYDLKLGIYLSPWDRHDKSYGTDSYNEFFCNQLTELCTNYGDLFCFWFDGACGEGSNGKKQVYDWDRYFDLISKLQPNACMSVCGNDVRWIGNEGGVARTSEWSVVPSRLQEQEDVMAKSQQQSGLFLPKIKSTDRDLGSREFLLKEDAYRWWPAEMNIPITYFGWFHRPIFERFITRSVKNLVKCYCSSVGNNAMFLVNVPPNAKGEMPVKFIRRLLKMNQIIKNMFSSKIDAEYEQIDENTFIFNIKGNDVSKLIIKEDITKSHRIEDFDIIIDGKKVYNAGAVGYQKFCIFKKTKAKEVIIKVNQKRAILFIKAIELYC